jgi:BirA family biotin operon repressor/biotin-[acetyl-CoA-carboxylase] ligase
MTPDPGPRTPDGAPCAPWLIHLDEVPSTNSWALERWQALAHGAVVYTTRQTGGRGRGGNTWEAPPGVLTASFVLHLPTDAGQLALAAGLATVHAVEDLVPGQRIGLKWPNDLVVGRRKLAGILCERPSPSVAVVGIGLNLAPEWPDSTWEDRTTSVAALGAAVTAADGLRVVGMIRRYLLEAAGLLRTGGFAALLPALRERDVLMGRTVLIEVGQERRGGLAEGLDDQGCLLVNGQALRAGHVAAWDDAPRVSGIG